MREGNGVRKGSFGFLPLSTEPAYHVSILEIFLRVVCVCVCVCVCVSGEEMQILLIDGDGEAGL